MLAVAALCASSTAASAQTAADFADWTSVSGGVAHGTLNGASISLSGSDVSSPPAGSVDRNETVFNRPEFTPSIPMSDAIHFVGSPGGTYALEFGAAQTDPVLHLGSLGSTLTFPDGTQIDRLSGDTEFSVAGNKVIGGLEAPTDDANGSVRLHGTFTTISFTATFPGSDGIYLQVGVARPVAPPPHPPAPPAPQTTTAAPAAATTGWGQTTTVRTGVDARQAALAELRQRFDRLRAGKPVVIRVRSAFVPLSSVLSGATPWMSLPAGVRAALRNLSLSPATVEAWATQPRSSRLPVNPWNSLSAVQRKGAVLLGLSPSGWNAVVKALRPGKLVNVTPKAGAVP
jgi:hypothetical protein